MKLRSLRILLLWSLIPAASACSFEQDTNTFESSAGRFRADFPSDPQSTVQNTSAEGVDLVLHFFSSETEDYTVSVGYVDYPSEFEEVDPKIVLAGVAPGAAGNIAGGTVIKNEPGTFLQFDSVDYRVSSEEVQLQAKAFLVKNRMYLLQAISEKLADADAEYERLVESFRLL